MARSKDESNIKTGEVPLIEGTFEPESGGWRRRVAPVGRLVDASSTAPIYFGIVVALVGFVLIVITWGEVAALTNVALQLPYLVSGGLTGLALVMVGMTIVNVQARRRDVAERARQMERLSGLLGEVGRKASANGARRTRSTRRARR